MSQLHSKPANSRQRAVSRLRAIPAMYDMVHETLAGRQVAGVFCPYVLSQSHRQRRLIAMEADDSELYEC